MALGRRAPAVLRSECRHPLGRVAPLLLPVRPVAAAAALGALVMAVVVGSAGATGAVQSAGSSAPCSARALFEAAVNKEHFNPNDPSYASFGRYGNDPGAYSVNCNAGWAVADISRPNVGTTDGATLFESKSGTWREVAQLGAGVAECNLEAHAVPATVARVLAHGVKGGGAIGCDAPGAYKFARQLWKSSACDSAAQQNSNDYPQIAAYLQQAGPAYGGDLAAYTSAIHELKNLAAIPETDATPAQSNDALSDIEHLGPIPVG